LDHVTSPSKRTHVPAVTAAGAGSDGAAVDRNVPPHILSGAAELGFSERAITHAVHALRRAFGPEHSSDLSLEETVAYLLDNPHTDDAAPASREGTLPEKHFTVPSHSPAQQRQKLQPRTPSHAQGKGNAASTKHAAVEVVDLVSDSD